MLTSLEMVPRRSPTRSRRRGPCWAAPPPWAPWAGQTRGRIRCWPGRSDAGDKDLGISLGLNPPKKNGISSLFWPTNTIKLLGLKQKCGSYQRTLKILHQSPSISIRDMDCTTEKWISVLSKWIKIDYTPNMLSMNGAHDFFYVGVRAHQG